MGCSESLLRGEQREERSGEQQEENRKKLFMSASLSKLLKSKKAEDQLKAFLLLDKFIVEEEKKSPSSVFGQAKLSHQLINVHLQNALETKNQNEFLADQCTIYEIFIDLGLTKSFDQVSEHEEFVASLNRRILNQNAINILENMLNQVQDRITKSSDNIWQLQGAYQQQDELISEIFGETYFSEAEKLLETELDTMRYYKDILFIGVLQWEVSVENVAKAARLSQEGVTFWKSIKNQALEKKIELATEARNCIQEAVLLIKLSEELLQDVQFPFCTTRERKGLLQALEYIFTDILIDDLYVHATEVYKNLHYRATSLEDWMKEVLRSKLQKHLFELEENVLNLSDRLKKERITQICQKLKIPNPEENLKPGDPSRPSLFQSSNDRKIMKSPSISDIFDFPVHLNVPLESRKNVEEEEENLKSYFDKILENRRKTMWPSRRIDELQNLLVQQ